MLGVVTSLLGGAIDPLIDRISTFSAILLRKVALFLVAALCMIVVLIALTVAFFLWVASRANPIAAALAVAGVYLAIAIVAILLALRGGAKAAPVAVADAPAAQARPADTQIDQFLAPLLALLAQFGLRREQLAVFAGATLAKRLGPVPLVALALIGGFLVGRMWKTWRHLLATDAIANLLASGLFGSAPAPGPGPDEA